MVPVEPFGVPGVQIPQLPSNNPPTWPILLMAGLDQFHVRFNPGREVRPPLALFGLSGDHKNIWFCIPNCVTPTTCPQSLIPVPKLCGEVPIGRPTRSVRLPTIPFAMDGVHRNGRVA